MHQTITQGDFRNAFYHMDRGNQFSYEALGSLFDYYEELEDSMDTSIELDVIEICCEWTEFEDKELMNDYGYMLDRDDYDDEEDYISALLDELRRKTTVIDVSNGNYLVMNR